MITGLGLCDGRQAAGVRRRRTENLGSQGIQKSPLAQHAETRLSCGDESLIQSQSQGALPGFQHGLASRGGLLLVPDTVSAVTGFDQTGFFQATLDAHMGRCVGACMPLSLGFGANRSIATMPSGSSRPCQQACLSSDRNTWTD